MDDALEIRLHGRGGQGTVTLAALLADAAFRSGWQAVGFPAFGTERTGAPVAAFVRLSRGPIRDRSEVRRPRVVVVQDRTLLDAVDVLDGAEPDAIILVNAREVPGGFRDTKEIRALPATEIALEHLGAPITSTAMLGFVAAATELVGIDAVCEAIDYRFRGEVATRNRAAARAAFAAARLAAETAA